MPVRSVNICMDDKLRNNNNDVLFEITNDKKKNIDRWDKQIAERY